jgi:hypothetical protein
MSCKEHTDLDVAVQIRKISRDGDALEHVNYPCPSNQPIPDVNVVKYLGPQGFLRASHAISKVEKLSTDQEIFYQHDRREPVPKGTIVPLNITLWPMGMVFEEGEGIMLKVAGHDMCLPEVEFLRETEAVDENVGIHELWMGGGYDSHLILPFI